MKLGSYILMLLFLGTIIDLSAQQVEPLIRSGNKSMEKKNYEHAEVYYKKALMEKSDDKRAVFNLGNALHKQQRYDEAIKQYSTASEMYDDKDSQAAAFHNIGNAYLEQDKYEKSIDFYKKALKLVPEDMDTKYNLAYAQEMLKRQQDQEQQEEENQEEEKDDQDQEENQDQDQEDKGDQEEDENGEGENSDGDQEEDTEKGEDGQEQDAGGEKEQEESPQQEGQQPQQLNLTKEEAEQILNAISNEEQKLQEDMKEETGTPININIEKDW